LNLPSWLATPGGLECTSYIDGLSIFASSTVWGNAIHLEAFFDRALFYKMVLA